MQCNHRNDAVLVYLRVCTYHFVVFYQHHVVSAQGSTEDDASHTLETMNPLLSLRPLATHIEHPVGTLKVSVSLLYGESM